MTAPAYTTLGKQVLHNGEHYADAATPEIATRIAHALNVLALVTSHPAPTNTDTARARA